jgi:hypothetical protein
MNIANSDGKVNIVGVRAVKVKKNREKKRRVRFSLV